MKCRHRLQAAAAKAVHELKQATGVSGNYNVSACREQIVDLATPKLRGGVGLKKIKHSRGTTAERRLGDLGDLEFGNSGKQSSRLFAYALRMLQMAGIVIGHAQLDRMARSRWRQFAQHFGDVFAFGGEGLSAFGPLRVVAQQVSVFLHGRSTTGRIDNDGVDTCMLERRD